MIRIRRNNREMAEWSIATVLKTVDCNRSGGSNPSLSAEINIKTHQKPANQRFAGFFSFHAMPNCSKNPNENVGYRGSDKTEQKLPYHTY